MNMLMIYIAHNGKRVLVMVGLQICEPNIKKIFCYAKDLKLWVIISKEDLHNKLTGDSGNSILASSNRFLAERFRDFML